MRKLFVVGALTVSFAVTGCGSKDVINKAPLTDAEKKQIQEDDRRVAEEESQGSVNKQKAGKKKP